MRRWHSRWSDLLAPLSEAGVDLVRAEYGVVSSEIRASWKTLVKALLVLLIALFALFWAIGAIALVVFEVGALWLPRWGAAAGVFALFLLVGLIFALLARRRMRGIEPPAETVRRRINEHRDWWDRRVTAVRPAGEPRRSSNGPATVSDEAREGLEEPDPRD